MNAVLLSLASVTAISLVSLVGVLTVSWSPDRLRRLTRAFISFAAGSLLGDAFIHLIPEAFGRREALPVSLLVLGGILGFFVIEKVIRSHGGGHDHVAHAVSPLVGTNIAGDALHNLVDGMLVASSYLVSIPLGISTTIAILLHELPQEIADFGILVHGGLSVRKALLYNLLSAAVAFVGMTAALILGTSIEAYAVTLIPITAGGFIYIAAADLIPEMHHGRPTWGESLLQLFLMCLGIGVMVLLRVVE